MAAYLKGAYPECVGELRAWLGGGAPEPPLASLAQAALARIRRFAQVDGQRALLSESAALHDALAAAPGRARESELAR
jgi:hypothetical protein